MAHAELPEHPEMRSVTEAALEAAIETLDPADFDAQVELEQRYDYGYYFAQVEEENATVTAELALARERLTQPDEQRRAA